MTASKTDALLGTVLSDRYRIDSLIGEGSMGRVYQGTHIALRNRVAIKVLLPAMTKNEEMVARFEREAIAAGNLSHRNIVGATDFGRTPDGRIFLVLEYVAGRSLFEALAEERPFPAERACHIASQILTALVHAHDKGIVHRDLKPENLVLVDRPEENEKDVVKVLDFGIAKIALPDLAGGVALTRLGLVYGTPEYLSPEQAVGQAVDHRADLYAVGVMLYEMLAGRRPFESDDPMALVAAHAQERATPPSKHASIAPALESVVLRLLEKAPSDRYPDACTALAALEEAERASAEEPVRKQPVDARAPTIAMAPSTAGEARAAPPGAASDGLRRAATKAARDVRAALGPLVTRVAGRVREKPRHAAAIGVGVLCFLALVLVVWPTDPETPVGGVSPGGAAFGGSTNPGAPSPGTSPRAPVPHRSIPELRKLVEEHPADPALRRQLASGWARAGDLAQAVRHYREALRLDPSLAADPEVHDHLVDALSSRRVWQDARDLLRDVIGIRALPALCTGAVEDHRMWVRRRSRELVDHFTAGRAPEWVLVAFAIDDARTCEDRSAAIARARALGDSRLASPLRRRRRDRRRADRSCDPEELASAIGAFGGG